MVAADFATPDAEAQVGRDVSRLTKADVVGIDRRARAAIKGYKNLSNRLGKYVNDQGQLVGYRGDPIRQQAGTGTGLLTSVLADGAVTESKLSGAVQTKLNTDTTTFSYPTRPLSLGAFASPPAAIVECQPNETVVGGGWRAGSLPTVYATNSYPTDDRKGWVVQMSNTGPGSATVTLYAICSSS